MARRWDEKHRRPVKLGPTARHHGGARPKSAINVIVVHDTEGGSAQGVADYFAVTPRVVSSHITVDNDAVVVCLPDLLIAWAAPGANTRGLQVEICGFGKWSRLQWYTNQARLKRAAWWIATKCVAYNIPPRWLTPAQVKAGHKGLCTHHDVTQAYPHLGTGHWDPGPNFPKTYFLRLVQRRVKQLKKEASL